jgi:hypothetical protein
MRPCVFCGSTAGRATDEHVIPKWARDGFDIQEWVTIDAADPGAALEQVGRLRHLNIVFRDGLCAQCNNEWLGPIENQAKAILLPMALEAKPIVLDAASQALLSFWAVKTVFLLEFAFRQRYRNAAGAARRRGGSSGAAASGQLSPAWGRVAVMAGGTGAGSPVLVCVGPSAGSVRAAGADTWS